MKTPVFKEVENMRILNADELSRLEGKYPLFFQAGYVKFCEDRGNKYYLVGDERGAVIPIKVQMKYLFKIGQYMNCPMKAGNRLQPEEEVSFIEAVAAFCKQQQLCDFILPPTHHFTNFSAVPAGSLATRLGVIFLDLSRDVESIFKGFSPNYRNEMRKAEAAGVKVYFDNTKFDVFYRLYEEVHARQHIYYDGASELKALLKCIGEKHYLLAFSEVNDKVTGAAIILKSGNEAIYYHSGTSAKTDLPGANKLMQFAIMKRLKEEGVERYYLGGCRYNNIAGTKYEGLQNFKMRFGAQVRDGYNFYSLTGSKYKVYSALMKLYLRMRGVKESPSALLYTKM